jgi:hypothetical protein
MNKYLFALAGGLVILAASPGHAAPVEADPNKEYVLTPEVGPCVICIKGYTGSSARRLANQLALHLRQNSFPAYVYDYSAEERRKIKEILEERYRNVPEMARRRTIRVEDQWGVLVGGYPDLDSASQDLNRIKKLPFHNLGKNELDYVPDMNTGRLLAVSPYAHCFATRNPLVPQPKPDPTAPDPAWKYLNEGRPYNLLDCGKPWTLAVKQFQGVNVVQARSASSKFLEVLGMGKSGEMLAASAKQAEEVVRVLRKLGYEAYVLHTRTASIVTVGAFDKPDDQRLQQAQMQLRKLTFQNPSDPQAAQFFQFFAQPMPMRVPQL